MNTIWKYVLDAELRQTISMPDGAEILSAGADGRDICLWVRVDDAAPETPRRFLVAGTGEQLPPEDGTTFIGTVQMPFIAGKNVVHLHSHPLVFHVFEITGPRRGV